LARAFEIGRDLAEDGLHIAGAQHLDVGRASAAGRQDKSEHQRPYGKLVFHLCLCSRLPLPVRRKAYTGRCHYQSVMLRRPRRGRRAARIS
jgi:hypothetical protein